MREEKGRRGRVIVLSYFRISFPGSLSDPSSLAATLITRSAHFPTLLSCLETARERERESEGEGEKATQTIARIVERERERGRRKGAAGVVDI